MSWRRAQGSGLRAESVLRADNQELKADDVVETATCDTIADGLAIRRPLAPNVAAIRELVDDVVAVSEQEMIAAIDLLYTASRWSPSRPAPRRRRRCLKYPAAARTSVVLVTGGNIAPDLMPKQEVTEDTEDAD